MVITPTEEQVEIVDAFSSRGSLVIEAGAGTGKTSTLRMCADSALMLAIRRAGGAPT